LPIDEPYVETDGLIVAEAENHHGMTPTGGVAWVEITGASMILNARNGAFLQALPDDGTQQTWATGAGVRYRLQINTPGVYSVSLRWDGSGGVGSNSLFFGILELADNAGNAPDWFEDSGNEYGDFDISGWDNLGGAEQNSAAASQDPMRFAFPSPGLYTLAIRNREDGAAVDAWRLDLLEAYPYDPSDSATLRHFGQARIAVLENDGGNFDASTVEILDAPRKGTAVVQSGGTILYTHTGASDDVADSFSYRAAFSGSDIFSEPISVALTITDAARFDSALVDFPKHPPPSTFELVEAFPGITFDSPHAFNPLPAGDPGILVGEGIGLIWSIPDAGAAAPEKVLYLDIKDRVRNDGNELALKGVAAHPDYETNGYIYVTYNAPAPAGDAVEWLSRLSRFSRSTVDPSVADPGSELILVEQRMEGFTHSIGSCRFGPDGYLYVAFGDEGPLRDDSRNGQRIDRELWSCIARIDVDKQPGNLEPNPYAAGELSDLKLDAFGDARYSVPADNPFVGATSFNGQPVSATDVRTEMYVVGLRNPWQFDFMPDSTSLIIGDVGELDYEEISILAPGGNGGWSWREGDQPGVRSGELINGAAEADATLVEPLHVYSHAVGFSVTGGLVYTHENYPGLNGLYLFSDFVNGSIWALDPYAGDADPVYLAQEDAITAFMLDPANNDILFLDRGVVGVDPGQGRIWRLSSSTDESLFPTTLSETNFFSDTATLTPNPGIVPYRPNLKFWSDHANKSRWFHIPDSADSIGFEEDAPWTFPEGMIWAKHFELEMERGNPASARRVETRFLVKQASGVYGVSYVWNDEETEATLAPAGGLDLAFEVTADGTTGIQQWRVPSHGECLTCHGEAPGYALSFNTRQLNREADNDELGSGNLLTLLENAGYLENYAHDPKELPRHVRPGQTEHSLEQRVRAYLDVNCAYCHQPRGGSPDSWNGLAGLKLFETGLINGRIGEPLDPSHRLVVPGDHNKSIIWNRATASNGYTRMPPLATSLVDEEGAELLMEWINRQLPSRKSYTEWRIEHFGDDLNGEGEAGGNGDGDALDNWGEYLAKTDPKVYDRPRPPQIERSEAGLSITRPGEIGRNFIIQHSNDLGRSDPWKRWDAPGNEITPVNESTEVVIPVPADAGAAFFRYVIEEL